MGYYVENYEDYIIKFNNISKSSLKNHIDIQKSFNNSLSTLDDWIKFLQKEQRETLKIWLDFLNSSDYDNNIKEWVLKGVLKSAYYESGHFRRRTPHTIHPFPEFNLRCVEASISEYHDKVSFKEIYAKAIKDLLMNKSDDGEWKVYSSTQQTINLINELQGWVTGWCISSESSAYLHLLAGDIHVYYSQIDGEFVYPRVAFGIERKGIIKCIGLERKQMVEECMIPILNDHVEKITISNGPNPPILKYGIQHT